MSQKGLFQGMSHKLESISHPVSSMYLLDVMLPNNIIVKGLRVGDGEFQGFDMLLGMDVISLGDFHLTNDGNTVFKFVIPPEENPNNHHAISQ